MNPEYPPNSASNAHVQRPHRYGHARAVWLACFTAAVSAACVAPPTERHEFRFELNAQSDDGKPLAGVTVARGSRQLGQTDANGTLALGLAGTEGQTVPLKLACPAGYAERKEPLNARLTSTRGIGQSASRALKLELVCQRKQRDVVLVVHAEGGADLPINVNGERAGTTDADGNAHVLLRTDRQVRTLEVELDVKQRKDIVLRNPKRLLALGESDTLLVVEQAATAPVVTPHFKVKVAPPTAPAAPLHHVPTRID